MSLVVDRLTFCYHSDRQTLSNVSFEAKEGRLTCLLGPNGAGKSTLISNVLGFVRPKSGTITVDGRELSSIPLGERAKKIGYVSQSVEFADMTCFDAVLLGRRPYFKWDAGEEDRRIVEQVFCDLHIEQFALRNVNELSGGEKQKIAVARAIAQGASVLLFDEPTGNLDMRNQLEVLSMLKKLAREKNVVIVVVMHDLTLAMRYGDDFLLLSGGSVQRQGEMKDLTAEDIRLVFGVDAELVEYQNKKILVFREEQK